MKRNTNRKRVVAEEIGLFMMGVPVALWGRDHQTTILYAETRAVDHRGVIPEDDPHMRTMTFGRDEYPTRLADGTELTKHDDYSCLKDAERAGFLTYENETVIFTDAGWKYAHPSAVRSSRRSGRS